MGLLLSTRRALIGGAGGWTPLEPTGDGHYPEHWYRSDQGLWQDAGTTPAITDGDVVGRWEDIATNADHTNQANAAKKPTLQNGAGDLLNGHSVIRFDGADDYLSGPYTNGGAMNHPNTIFGVFDMDAAQVNDGVYHTAVASDSGVNFHSLLQNAGAAPDNFAIYAGAFVGTAASNANWNIWTALFNGASSALWHNGVAHGVGNAGAFLPSGIVIGARAGPLLYWKGDFTEVILYDANLSDADKNQVGQYLATRYALAYTDI